MPAEIILKDYNYEKPSLDITSRADVDPAGRGVSYLYGEYFATPEEGERLATIRAEELLCEKQEFFGESTVPYIMPGFTFNLNNHYREDFNQEYLIIEVTHEGNQSHLMSGGISSDSGKSHNQAIYHNSFKAIPNETQYRPDRITDKPKISGTIHAKIDSEVAGEYAQIDEQGRYRVKLPFDINDEHMDGKGSAPIRMMQSYAGKDRGMQFPLVKDTEVLLTFIEGNPDRPVIAGAVSNPETRGPVNADNQSESVIQTGGNNRIRMEDKAGSERVMLESPAANSWVRIGEPNDPVALNGSATVYLTVNQEYVEEGAYTAQNGTRTDISAPGLIKATGDSTDTAIPLDRTIAGSSYTLVYYDGLDEAQRTVKIVSDRCAVEPNPGIREQTSGSLYHEAQSQFAMYAKGAPTFESMPRKTVPPGAQDDDIPNQIGDIYRKFTGDDGLTDIPYVPKGMISMQGEPQPDFVCDVLKNAHITMSSLDTVNTQEGNIYDFGGYWNYNLGNSYTENHIDQSAALNQDEGAAKTITDTYNDTLDDLKDDLAVLMADMDSMSSSAGQTAIDARQTAIDAKEGEIKRHKLAKPFVPVHDLLKKGGPDWLSIEWPAVTGKLSESESKLDDPFYEEGSPPSMWVDKSFGNSYEYRNGDAISVAVGSTLDVEHGGRHVEVSYRGSGSIKSWSIRGAGGTKPSEEKKWTGAGTLVYHSKSWVTDAYVREHESKYDRNTGDLFSFSGSEGTGMGQSSFDFNYSNKISMAIDSGSQTSSSTFLGAQISNDNYVGVKIENSNAVGAMMKFEFSPMVLEVKNSKVESNIPGMKIKAEASALENRMSKIENDLTYVANVLSHVANSASSVQNQTVKASNTATVDSSL